MTIGTRLHTWLFGRLVGSDGQENRYYEGRKANSEGRLPRWVLYKGEAEPSKVPPHWYGWLHYTSDALPENAPSKRYAWQKDSLPNLTGTPLAYRPPGHVLKGGVRAPAVSDYEPWSPS